jgi:hypothetical protein
MNARGNAMELDGFNSDLSLGFEHNGQQHYGLDGFFTTRPDQLESRLADDAEKLRLCKVNGVTLIVVPFSVPLKSVQSYVLRELAAIDIVPPNTISFDPGIVSLSTLAGLRQHAELLGGQLLSERYQGSAAKLRWKCKNPDHPPFETTPSAVINNGHWCRRCAAEKASDSHRISVSQVQEWARAAQGELLVGDPDGVPAPEKGFALSDGAWFRCGACQRRQLRKIRQVKDGRLCLCHTNKTRIDRPVIKTKLAERSMILIEPGPNLRGRSDITIQCSKCSETWTVKASRVVNGSVGCPRCRRNATITREKALALGESIGFELRSDTVRAPCANMT